MTPPQASPAEPLWLEEVADALPRWREPPADARCEVLVIGAGLAGTSVARALAAHGVDVLLVDRAGPGRGASGRNAGFVLLAHVFELPAMAERFGEPAVLDLLALARRNHARIREHASACDHRPCGSRMLSMAGDEAEAATLARAGELLRAAGVDARLGAPHPALRGFGAQLALAEDAQLHPGKLVAALAADVRRAARAQIDALRDGVARIADGGTIRFERAVVATNAHAGRLVPSLRGVVTPERAQILATEPLPERVLEPVAYANWGHDYFRQRDDGVLLLGGRRHLFVDRESTDDEAPTDAVQRALDAYLQEHLPFTRGARVTHRWAGTMGFSPDELPLMGPAPGLRGVHVLAGFTGHGLGLAPVLGELLADRLAGRASAADARVARLFDPQRFA